MDIRYHPGQSVPIELLDSSELLQGEILQLVGRAAILNLARSLQLEALVKIELEDCMLLGEVVACESHTGRHLVRVEVCDAVPVMSDLARLVSAVMGNAASSNSPQDIGNGRFVGAEILSRPKEKVIPKDHLI